MSFESMLDHRVILYRPSAGGIDANGDPTAAFTTVTTPAGKNARSDVSWSGALGVSPIGEVQTEMRVWGLHRGFTNIEERDILDVIEGPMAPNRYRIHSINKVTNLTGVIHHVEVATQTYEGAIT